jgi:predicted ATPase
VTESIDRHEEGPLMDSHKSPDSTVIIPRVVLKNYKSIAVCDVPLQPLTVLVGANGSGKSNFVDGIRFVADALRTSLDHALRDRGGIKEVRRRSGGHPTHFAIRLDLTLRNLRGHYAFRIGAKKPGGFEVQQEECVIGKDYYQVTAGRVIRSSIGTPPAPAIDRLYLVNASGIPEFRPVYDALSTMGFYNLNPDEIRELQSPDPGKLLIRDGGNIASVLDQIQSHAPNVKGRIEEYLAKVVAGITGVSSKVVGPKETLEFRQKVVGSKEPWRLIAANMSDGTLRALGVLVAIFQSTDAANVPLVAIEEPEVALHPAAAGILRDSLRAASISTQLLVTSHSPDLLDDPTFDSDGLLAVVAVEGATSVAPLDEAGRRVLRDHLYTAGELLRMNQLIPDPVAIKSVTDSEPSLFDLL